MIVTAHTVWAKVLEESIVSETHILEPLDPQIQGKSGVPSTLISPSVTVVGTALYIKVLNNFNLIWLLRLFQPNESVGITSLIGQEASVNDK